MTVIMRLNTWANMCGHFFNCCLTPGFENKPDVNNGYNCNHLEQEEEYEGVGCCFAHSCPLAYPADGGDCKKFGIDCENCGNEECECDEDMMVCEIPDDQFDERYMYREIAQAGEESK